jgi:hypothetical protein
MFHLKCDKYIESATDTSRTLTLRPELEGWTLPYELKMAYFTELRGGDEVVLRYVRLLRAFHSLKLSGRYQDVYTPLTIMFGSTSILPPRIEQRAEARALANSINFKVSFCAFSRTYILAELLSLLTFPPSWQVRRGPLWQIRLALYHQDVVLFSIVG